jgi:phosphatidate cytidylyltransferase
MSKKYVNDDIDSKRIKNSNVKKIEEKENLTEYASGTCFSSEQETKFKSKPNIISRTITKVTTGFPKILMPPQTVDQEQIKNNRWADLVQRTKWTLLMLLGFIGFIMLGNFYCALLVLFIIMAIFKELLDLSRYKDRNNEVKNYYLVSWYFFLLCIYYFYIKILNDKLIHLNKYRIINYLLKYHNLVSFMLYMCGFFLFINSLTKGYYKYQFRTFAWIHIILFIFGISSSLITANIFNGMVWFILPCSLVICNDISAYIFGRLFGKTPLSPLSPKKTVEGFIGGLFCTLIWGYIVNLP